MTHPLRDVADIDKLTVPPPEGGIYNSNRYTLAGLLDGLGMELHDCGIVKDLGPSGFFEQARLRSTGELLDAADHIYRLHWAVRQARTSGTFPAPQVVAGVVMERHHTLNWLIGHGDQPWDQVSTDT